MELPICRIDCVGEVSVWGREFITQLQQNHIAEVSFQSVPEFITSLAPRTEVQVVLIENQPDCKTRIKKLRATGRPFFLIWFGRNFVKEDYAFALEHRAYCLLEQPKVSDKATTQCFDHVNQARDRFHQFERLMHTIKSMLLQNRDDISDKTFLTELKTAFAKLELAGVGDELLGGTRMTTEGGVPFYRAQGFSDALITIQDLERTGELWVRGPLPGEEGKVQFLQGKVIGARTGGVHGLKAIFRMFLWDEPRFLFSRRAPEEFTMEEPIPFSIRHLCEEGENYKNRFEHIRKDIPPADIALRLQPAAMHAGTKISHEEFSTLASVIEFREVAQIADFNDLPDTVVYESLIRLRKHNLITVA